MSLFTPSSTGSYRYGRFNGPLEYLEIIVEQVLLVSCQNIVTLNAQILGDQTDHTFYWEQTGGPSVIWLEPQNQIMVMYEKNPSDTNGDCFFRFWIDRYTPFQQFRDLVVSGSARDDAFLNSNQNVVGISTDPLPTIVYNVFPGLTFTQTVTVDNPDRIFSFTLPTSLPPPGKFTKNVVYEYDNGVSTFFAELSPDRNWVFNPDIAKKYFIRYYYTLYDLYESYYETSPLSITYDTSNLTTLDSGETLPQIMTVSNIGASSFFQTALLELSSLEDQDNVLGLNSTNVQSGGSSFFQTQIIEIAVIIDSLQDNATGINTSIKNTGSSVVFQVQISDGITVIG